MSETNFDVAVIGGGIGACVLSTFLVQKGYRVVMIERERFPRFHVGESLLPATQEIWERMGFAERLQYGGHTFKYAGEFRVARTPISDDICCTTGFFNNFPRKDVGPRPYAYQVERAVFDKQLQDFAVGQGVTLWDKSAVVEVLFDPPPPSGASLGGRAVALKIRREDRQIETLTPRFIVDASGRRCVIARQLGCIEDDPEIKTSAVFGHFQGVMRDPGFRQGFFNGYFIENGWIWFIPLVHDIMSVGLVQNQPSNLSWTNDPEEVLLAAINRYKFIQDRFRSAVQVGRVRTIKGLAYQTRTHCGDGWLSLGDANFFVDPLYSSGVQIAHKTGEMAAGAVDGFLRNGRDMRAIRRYERFIRRYRRNVFGPMRTLYRLMRHYECIDAYVRVTGLWCHNFNNWFLRRANCWGSGYFHQYVWAVRIMEWVGNALARWGPMVFRLRNDDGWKAYARNPNLAPPLVIPKHASLQHRAPKEQGAFQPLTLKLGGMPDGNGQPATPQQGRHTATPHEPASADAILTGS